MKLRKVKWHITLLISLKNYKVGYVVDLVVTFKCRVIYEHQEGDISCRM